MGITGLLPALKKVTKLGSIHEFQGKTVAVDTYCWLHRAVYGSCAEMFRGVEYDPLSNTYRIVTAGSSGNKDNRGTNKFIECLDEEQDITTRNLKWVGYIKQFIDMLLHHNITVYLVFDGNNLPAKQKTEAERSNTRGECLRKGMEALRKSSNEHEARQYLSRAIDITPRMAAMLIKICKQSYDSSKVKYLVAPYEADAQLAYLSRNDIVDAVISEDSDVIPYGCKNCIFKLEKDGSCQIIKQADLFEQHIPGFDLRNFDKDMLLATCIASGCDYLPSLNNFGLKKSHKYVTRYKQANKMLRALRFEGLIPITVPDVELPQGSKRLFQYEIEFYKAILTFQHQVVFCPRLRKLVNLTPICETSASSELLPYIKAAATTNGGEIGNLESTKMLADYVKTFVGNVDLGDEIGQGIAEGILDPSSKLAFNFTTDSSNNDVHDNGNAIAHTGGDSIHDNKWTTKERKATKQSKIGGITQFLKKGDMNSSSFSSFSRATSTTNTYNDNNGEKPNKLAKSLSMKSSSGSSSGSIPQLFRSRSAGNPARLSTIESVSSSSKGIIRPTYNDKGEKIQPRKTPNIGPFFSNNGPKLVAPIRTETMIRNLDAAKKLESSKRLTSMQEDIEDHVEETGYGTATIVTGAGSHRSGGDKNDRDNNYYNDDCGDYEMSLSPPIIKKSFSMFAYSQESTSSTVLPSASTITTDENKPQPSYAEYDSPAKNTRAKVAALKADQSSSPSMELKTSPYNIDGGTDLKRKHVDSSCSASRREKIIAVGPKEKDKKVNGEIFASLSHTSHCSSGNGVSERRRSNNDRGELFAMFKCE